MNVILIWLGSLFILGILFALTSGGLIRVFELAGNENAFVAAAFSSGLAILLSPLSLVLSYKACLRFAKALQARGWKIENPKKLFLAALGILLLPLILLILWGALASADSPEGHKPEKPPKAIHRRCKPFKKPKRNGKPRKPKKHPFKNPCTTLYNLDQIVDGEEEITEVLPELLSSELTQNFSGEEFEAAIDAAAEAFGEIESISYPEEFVIQGDWAEAEIEITTTKGQVLKFLVIFHKEDGEWKIFGTEEI